jgi:hypothetical protein
MRHVYASRKAEMKNSSRDKAVLYVALLLLILSVVLAVVSFFPVAGSHAETSVIIDDSFRLTPQETWRQGLGSFHGDENISVSVSTQQSAVNFTLITYGGLRYSNLSTSNIRYSFPAGADYYEAIFSTNSTIPADIHFQVSIQKLETTYPFSWLATPAKALFLLSWGAVMLLLLLMKSNNTEPNALAPQKTAVPLLSQKVLRRLRVALLLSLVFWFLLLAANTYPLGAFENWYTDHARHPYSATLFTKVGFSIFDTPLGKLASNDSSLYKFVTWPDMPHLYSLGSVFLFLPFGMLLENGVAQILVLKMEIAFFLVVSHICLYYFLKRFWKQEMTFALKAAAVYILYIVLVVYSANGMFDAVAFLFSMIAIVMFLENRHDLLLLFVAISATFKYQAGIFLLPLAMVSLTKLAQQSNLSSILKNKAVLAAVGLAALNFFTAYLSAPFLIGARPELVMNGVNAFSPHSQIPWWLQSLAVMLTLSMTMASTVYLFNRSRLVSLFAVFSLLPSFTMPYFQPWYLSSFFVYALIPQKKRALEVTTVWLIFMVIVLSFGGLAYNPATILENIRRVLNL